MQLLGKFIIVFTILFAVSNKAYSEIQPCAPVQNFIKLRNENVWGLNNQTEKASLRQQLNNEAKTAAQNLFAEYLKGNISFNYFEFCVPLPSDREFLIPVLNRVFFQESIAKLKDSGIADLVALARQIDEFTKKTGTFLFRVDLHYLQRKDPPAGFHRATNLVFMNMTRIDGRIWLLYFVHEMVHLLDPILKSASLSWNNSAQTQSLRDSIMDGFNRGLLAEFRAWLFPLRVHEQAVVQGLWLPFPKLDEALAKSGLGHTLKELDSLEKWKKYVFTLLDSRFIEIVDLNNFGEQTQENLRILNLPSVLETAEVMRDEFRRNPESLEIFQVQSSMEGK